MKKKIFVDTDVVGYCTRNPNPPMSARPEPADQPGAEDAEPGNQFDTDETTRLADETNNNWKRDCPAEWKRFREAVRENQDD